MNRTYCFLFCFFCVTQLFQAQTTIQVFDENQIALYDVEVRNSSNKVLGYTNIDGGFEVFPEFKTIQLLLEGYKDVKIDLNSPKLKIVMEELSIALEEIEFTNDDSAARNLIQKVRNNYKKNSPENLKSFQYNTYSKFWVKTQKDSIPVIEFPQNKTDSSRNEFRTFLDKSLLFLGERAMQHKFDKNYGRKNIVLANRVSGLTSTLYEFISAQPISHTFDQDKFSFFFSRHINPVSGEGLQTYNYRIIDTLQYKNTQAIEVGFKPKSKKKDKTKIRGKVWIDSKSFALIRFSAESTSRKRVVELEMNWMKYRNYWFPKEQRFLADTGDVEYPVDKDSIAPDGTIVIDTIQKKQTVWANMVNTFKNFESPVEFEKREFRGYENEIAAKAFDEWDVILEKYRDKPLDSIEQNTYITLDSIAKEEKAERLFKLMRIVSRNGKYEVGKIDFDITKLFAYNDFEGFRLGTGLSTNYRWSENYSVNAYGAYGFKDKRFKHGFGMDWFVNKPFSGRVFANYANDVAPSGRTDYTLQNAFGRQLEGSLDNILNNQFYTFKKIKLGYEQDFLKNITAKISVNYTDFRTRFGYAFQNFGLDQDHKLSKLSLALRWSPKSEYLRTPFGKVTVKTDLPVFYLNLNQAIKTFDSDFAFTKLEGRMMHRARWFGGRTNVMLRSGVVLGDAPIISLFEGLGNGRNRTSIGGRFSLASNHTFETMQPGEFYSDRYISYQFKHQIAGFELLNKQIYPTLIYRGLIGTLDDVKDHVGFNFQVPNNLYQEVGMEMNSFIFGVLGIGAYYRFGTYSLGDVDENLTYKLTIKINMF